MPCCINSRSEILRALVNIVGEHFIPEPFRSIALSGKALEWLLKPISPDESFGYVEFGNHLFRLSAFALSKISDHGAYFHPLFAPTFQYSRHSLFIQAYLPTELDLGIHQTSHLKFTPLDFPFHFDFPARIDNFHIFDTQIHIRFASENSLSVVLHPKDEWLPIYLEEEDDVSASLCV